MVKSGEQVREIFAQLQLELAEMIRLNDEDAVLTERMLEAKTRAEYRALRDEQMRVMRLSREALERHKELTGRMLKLLEQEAPEGDESP